MAKVASKNQLNLWQAKLAGEAAIAVEEAGKGSGGAFISTRGGRLSVDGTEVPGNKLNFVIIDSVMENQYYTDAFDPTKLASPVCFAFGRSEGMMAPHEDSLDPQADMCKGCPQNDWGSADTGKGKACKNIRRLALITEDSLDDIDNAEVRYLKVPVMSVKGWMGYVKQVGDVLKRPPFAVVTEVSVVPDDKSQFRVNFKLMEQIEDSAQLEALMALRGRVKDEIEFPYQAPAPAPEPAPVAKKGAKPAPVKSRKY